MTTHTPGPWACTYTSNHAHDYRLSRPHGPMTLNIEANDHGEQRANARLIAAAPDLLALCVRALRAIDEDTYTQLRDDLHAAINKATQGA